MRGLFSRLFVSYFLSLSLIFTFVHNSISTTFSGLNECCNDHSPRELKNRGEEKKEREAVCEEVLPMSTFSIVFLLIIISHLSKGQEEEKENKICMATTMSLAQVFFFSHFPLDLIGLTSVVRTELFSKLSKAHQNSFLSVHD